MKTQKSWLVATLTLSIIVYAGWTMVTDGGAGGTSQQSSSWQQSDNSSMAYIMMEDFVKQRLRSPSTADFPGVFAGRNDHITSLGDNRYRIVSYVDSQNGFGAEMRTHFKGEIEQTSKREWRLHSLEFVQR